MNVAKARDITLIICAIVFVLVVSISSLLPILAPAWYNSRITSGILPMLNAPTVYSDCQTNGNKHSLTITVTNYGLDDLKDIKCNLIDKSGLTSLKDSQSIPSLETQSTDICNFDLEGVYERPLRYEIVYGEKSIKQVAECYGYTY